MHQTPAYTWRSHGGGCRSEHVYNFEKEQIFLDRIEK